MPRRPRLVECQVPLHIIQRGNNRQPCFASESDYLVYLDLLRRAARAAECAIHAYVLMGNHVHILATPASRESPGQMMKAVGERYVRYFNERHERTGTLWDGRFKSCLVHSETYLMVCYRYIELNPLRAGMVSEPLQYRWSSHPTNAKGARDPLITPHYIYQSLGPDDEARQSAYRALFAQDIAEEHVVALRDATNHNYACGDRPSIQKIERTLGHAAVRKPALGRRDA